MPGKIKQQLYAVVMDILGDMHHLSNAQIAEATGVPIGDVARLMKSREVVESMSLDRYVEIARALGLEVKPLELVPCEPKPVEQRRKRTDRAADRLNRFEQAKRDDEAMGVIMMGLDSESLKAAGVNPVG